MGRDIPGALARLAGSRISWLRRRLPTATCRSLSASSAQAAAEPGMAMFERITGMAPGLLAYQCAYRPGLEVIEDAGYALLCWTPRR